MTKRTTNNTLTIRRIQFGGLWRHPDFTRLWMGQTISEFGTWLGALSLLAILSLNASPAQMGVLETLRSLPALLLGLFAGVWIDRLRRRPIMILGDVGRALLLGLAVLLAFLGLLQMAHLYAVAFLVGSLTVVFSLAYQAYVPSLVRREQLVEANSKLGASASLAEIASPGLGGVLVQLISAPLTLLLDAISFLVSALFVGLIRVPEPPPSVQERQGRAWGDITTGLRLVLGHPLLRSIAGASGTRSFFGGFFGALYALFVLREVGLGPAVLGLLIGSGGVGSLIGALLTGQITERLGLGNSLIMGMSAAGILALLIPLAGGPAPVAIAILLMSQVIGDAFFTIYFIGELSLRQTITPDNLLGRVNASIGFLVSGAGTLGILLGGLIGEFIGLRPAIFIAAAGVLTPVLWLFFSPVRGLTDLSDWYLKPG